MLIVPFVLEISFTGTYADRNWANVQHLVWDADTGDRTPANLLTIATQMEVAWQQLAVAMNEHAVLDNIKVTDLDSALGHVIDLASSETGGRASAGMPGNCAVLVTKVDSHGRSQRPGRSFFVGPCEVDTAAANPSTLDATGLSTWAGAVSDYRSELTTVVAGENVYPCVLHKTAGGSGYTPYNMSGMSVNARLATQRRRLR